MLRRTSASANDDDDVVMCISDGLFAVVTIKVVGILLLMFTTVAYKGFHSGPASG